MKPALFLDRDGVINREVNYLYRIEDFEFIPGTFSACRFFQDYFSPYHPTPGMGAYRRDHPDRKPSPGMMHRAQQDWQIDLGTSIIVGDKESDIQAGIAAGLGTTGLVRSGHSINEADTHASLVINSLAELPDLFSRANPPD